jgi:hypothetical protein
MTPDNWNHLFDVCGDVVKYLLGPVIVAVVGAGVTWWRAKVEADKLKTSTERAAVLVSDKTDQQTQTLIKQNRVATAEQTKVLVEQSVKTQDAVELVHLATNGMKDALVNAAYKAGGDDQKAKVR